MVHRKSRERKKSGNRTVKEIWVEQVITQERGTRGQGKTNKIKSTKNERYTVIETFQLRL